MGYFDHGNRHGPEGTDPAIAGAWRNVGDSGGTWSSATTYSPGDRVTAADHFIYQAIRTSLNVQPGVATGWQDKWIVDGSAFQNSWANVGGTEAPMRYRLVVGPKSAAGSSIDARQSCLELQGSINTGSYGTVAFTLPDGYRPDSTIFLDGIDSSGNLVYFQVDSNGDVTPQQGSIVFPTSGVTAGTYGDSTHVAQVTVNNKGIVTGISSVSIANISPLTTKGDLYTYSTTNARLGVGSNNTVLIADSSQTTGLKWAQVGEAMILLSDVTTDNVTSSAHGFAPKSPADATQFLNGDTTPGYAQVKDSDLSTSDITTNNVSTTKHGFAPKAPADATKYLDGTGAWSTPAGGGGSGSQADAVFDTKPASPHADNAEFDSGTSLPTGWNIAVSGGTLTNARLSNPLDTSPSNPTWNVNQDLPGTLVMQPQLGGVMKLWRAFAPAAGTRWMIVCKFRLGNMPDQDDRVHFGVSKSATSPTSSDEPDDSIWIERRNSSSAFAVSDYWKNGGSLQPRENEQAYAYSNGFIFFMILGHTDNSIDSWHSWDGFVWRKQVTVSGKNVNGNVTHAWITVADNNFAGFASAYGIVDFVRFYEGAANPFLVGGGG